MCSRSIWAYAQFSPLLSNLKKIPRDIAARIDEIVLTGETETSLNSTEVSHGTSNMNPSGLPDLETICKKQIPTLRYIPVKFRLSWSDVFTKTIEGCISQPNCTENWKKLFAISKCILRASNRGGKKHKQNQENLLSKRCERWKAGDYAGLWYEAASMKQSRKNVTESIEALAARAKALCLQSQFGRAAKILSSDGVAPDIQTFRELKTLRPQEEEPRLLFQDYSSQAHQFDEPTVFGQIESFPNFSAPGPSKMYAEHLLHAVNCAASDQSKQAITSITKLVNLASRGQLPVSVAPVFCSASLTALKKTKRRCTSDSCGRGLATSGCKMHSQTNTNRVGRTVLIQTTRCRSQGWG